MAEEKKFKRGDVVRLKSGGPNMTVVEYRMWHDTLHMFSGKPKQPSFETDVVYCTWFGDKQKREGGEFHQDLLELISDPHSTGLNI